MSSLGLALVAGIIFGTGVYLLLRPNLGRVIIGFILFGNAINLMILSSQKVLVGSSPILNEVSASTGLTAAVPADALPQALILTAIVIGFGIMLVLLGIGSRSAHERSPWDSEEGNHG